jgi:transcriptional regulator with GAF, ATPase, and Fis domain
MERDIIMRTMVELADTLVEDFDVVDLLTIVADRCVEALDVSAAGLLLASTGGDLRVVASSSEAMRVVELFELQEAEGPCWDCYRTGEPVGAAGVDSMRATWPRFTPVVIEAGFASASAIPMRLRGDVIGALNLFRVDPIGLAPDDVLAGQALADVATIAVLQYRAGREVPLVDGQLALALNTRILVEQAKGVLCQRVGIDSEAAFSLMREYARSHDQHLTDVARGVIGGLLMAETAP